MIIDLNKVYNNPFILNKYLKKYKLIEDDKELYFMNKKSKKIICLFSGAYNLSNNIKDIETSLDNIL